MHGSSLVRMAWFVKTYLTRLPPFRVLDVGSMDVAGGTYRHFFDTLPCHYDGLDLVPGPNVDIVPQLPYHWPELASESYDVVISGQAMEHMEFFWLAAAEMARILKEGGLLCLVAPRGFARHRYPVDCWRFDADGMVAIARYCNLQPLHASCDMCPPDGDASWHIEHCEDALLVARKPEHWQGVIAAEHYRFEPAPMTALAGDFQPCPPLVIPPTIPQWEHEQVCGALRKEHTALASKLREKEEEIAALRRRISGYEKSKSWRITRPLRAMTQAWRQWRRSNEK